MGIKRLAIGAVATALLALAACATSLEDEQRRKDMEADIDEIMSYELDKTEFGEPRNCLSESQYRSIRALGDRHLLFEGRRGKLWVNVLRGRCSGMDNDSIFVIRPSFGGRPCERDRFEAIDRLDATSAMGGAGMGPVCILGEFKPVAKAQLEEIEARLEMS